MARAGSSPTLLFAQHSPRIETVKFPETKRSVRLVLKHHCRPNSGCARIVFNRLLSVTYDGRRKVLNAALVWQRNKFRFPNHIAKLPVLPVRFGLLNPFFRAGNEIPPYVPIANRIAADDHDETVLERLYAHCLAWAGTRPPSSVVGLSGLRQRPSTPPIPDIPPAAPALNHWVVGTRDTAPALIGCTKPRLSRYMISPSNRYVMVAIPTCGCGRTWIPFPGGNSAGPM